MQIEDYSFGRIVIDGRAYTRDLIILPGRILAGWWRREGHSLALEDLEPVLAAQTEVLVVGTGAHGGMRVPEQTRRALAERGIELLVAPTARACELHDELSGARCTSAALHLTC